MAGVLSLFLCGDVMLGRGMDQILGSPSAPELYEPYVRDARDYLRLAEAASGPIPRPAGPEYVWGEALAELTRRDPQLRLVNLETSITTRGAPWPGKSIHYRMHPRNIACLGAAGIDCVSLANNHVMDWGRDGLVETLTTLSTAGIAAVGAGEGASAWAPAELSVPGGRVLVLGAGAENSGIPPAWAAAPARPGVALLPELSAAEARRLGEALAARKRPGDVAVVSLHWGGNWGYDIPEAHRRFAHALIDHGVDVVHGHSSHHPLVTEVYRGRPILYGCGDFLNDYEGIGGYAAFRGELTLMYFLDLEPARGELTALHLVPLRLRRFRLQRANEEERDWLRRLLSRLGRAVGTDVRAGPEGDLELLW